LLSVISDFAMYVCTRIYIVIAVDSGIVITIKSYCGNCFSFPLHVHTECKYLQKKEHVVNPL